MQHAAPARYRNFDTLRLIAASSVLFSHAYGIAEGHDRNEPFVRMLGKGQIAGLYGVYVFFILSGFLVTRSFLQRKSLRGYVTKRLLRIVPGLVACAAVCALGVGTLFTSMPRGEYLGHAAVRRYVWQTSLFFDTSDRGLPGVVFADNDYGRIVNGSLWTLGPELACYAVVMVPGLFPSGRATLMAVLFVFGLWARVNGVGGSFGFLWVFFAAGALTYFMQGVSGGARFALRTVCAAGLLCGVLLELPAEAFALFGAPLVIELGTTSVVNLGRGARFGDLSYGLYLYGWPIEQMVCSLLGAAARPWLVFAISLPLAACAGLLSWHLLEKHALKAALRARAPSGPARRRCPSRPRRRRSGRPCTSGRRSPPPA